MSDEIIEGTYEPSGVATVPAVANPLDVSPEAFRANLDRRRENRGLMMEWVRGQLVEGSDFGSIEIRGRKSKPSLWKAGAEKICGILGLRVEFPNLADYEEKVLRGEKIEHILLRCHLYDGAGNIVASGAGARSLNQDQGDLNKALKMCMKSAQIDATLRCAGLSEVFTQDIEDMAPSHFEDTSPGQSHQQADAIPIGKHKGTPYSDLDLGYVVWGAQNLSAGKVKDRLRDELERRFGGANQARLQRWWDEYANRNGGALVCAFIEEYMRNLEDGPVAPHQDPDDDLPW